MKAKEKFAHQASRSLYKYKDNGQGLSEDGDIQDLGFFA